MKKHLVNITYDFGYIFNDNGDRIGYEYFNDYYTYQGLVTGLEVNNKVVIDPVKIFEKAFNKKWPSRTCTITIN